MANCRKEQGGRPHLQTEEGWQNWGKEAEQMGYWIGKDQQIVTYHYARRFSACLQIWKRLNCCVCVCWTNDQSKNVSGVSSEVLNSLPFITFTFCNLIRLRGNVPQFSILLIPIFNQKFRFLRLFGCMKFLSFYDLILPVYKRIKPFCRVYIVTVIFFFFNFSGRVWK